MANKDLGWPWSEWRCESPGIWGATRPVHLWWDQRAHRLACAAGPIAWDAPITLVPNVAKPEAPFTWVAKWLRERGYHNARIEAAAAPQK